ncbi:MAG TPA: nucleoside-diphosphate kinase [archaeon]|nr:nucleoside-diphosphate kinase [archaeon]
MERTLVVVKPDGMKRNLVGKIISRFEQEGLKVVAMKMVNVTKKLAEKHYTDSDTQVIGMGNKTLSATGETRSNELFGTADAKKIGIKLREWMIDFITSTPVVAFILEGHDAVAKVRKIVGFTDPTRADKGTIRGDLGTDSIMKANEEKRATENLVHASGSVEEAEKEIKMWFDEKEIFSSKQ